MQGYYINQMTQAADADAAAAQPKSTMWGCHATHARIMRCVCPHLWVWEGSELWIPLQCLWVIPCCCQLHSADLPSDCASEWQGEEGDGALVVTLEALRLRGSSVQPATRHHKQAAAISGSGV
jgi:hypothetical protein